MWKINKIDMNNLKAVNKVKQSDFVSKIFAWQAIALFVSASAAFKVAQSFLFVQQVTSNPIILIVLIVAQLGFVFWIISNLKGISSNNTILVFALYSISNGLIISLVFKYLFYDFQIGVFLVISGMYLIMSILGYFSKQVFNNWVGLMFMVFTGLGLDLALNMIWRNDQTQLIIAALSVLIFVGITAYTFKNNIDFDENQNTIKGAFSNYLNLFFLFLVIFISENKSNKRIHG